jgi:hypothetical protein
MGFRVEKYDLHELGRISLPGMVVPSLFWVLPVGHWTPYDVDSLWRHFTQTEGNCKRYGLLLVRDIAHQHERGKERADLAEIAASLKDILPAGASRHLPRSLDEGGERFVLVMSGAYPQPGWGVLVTINHNAPADSVIERLVASTLEALGEQAAPELASLGLAADSYHRRNRLAQFRGSSTEITDLRRRLDALRTIVGPTQAILAALTCDDLEDLASKIKSFVSAARNHPADAAYEEKLAELIRLRHILTNAQAFLDTPADVLARDVLPIRLAISKDPESKGDRMRSCDKSVRNAIASLFAVEKFAPLTEGDIHASVVRASRDSRAEIQALVSELQGAVGTELPELESQYARLAEAERQDHLRRQAMIDQANREFADSLEITSKIQWKLGPNFLVALQDAARVEFIEAISIAWDAPRMVGWKLLGKGAEITLRDVRTVALELHVPPPEPTVQQDSALDAPIDGSYFTDYVHFIAISSLETSPREISCRLVASLLRPSQLGNLIQEFGGQRPSGEDRSQLSDALLSIMGWQPSGKDHPKPLISYSDMLDSKNASPSLPPDPVAIRKSLESFCKDVLDVLAHKLGNSDDRIWSAIDCGDPPYIPISARRSWQEEFARCTAGSGAILIELLGRALPQMATDCQKLADDVSSLGASLNQQMHHQETGSGTEEAKFSGTLIRQVIEKAAGILGEVPWHFTPTVRFGDSPKVWSGPAWSHAHVAPRLLRVISLMDDFHGDETLVWNQSGTNPVIADPVFLDRNRHRRR